MRTRRSAPSLMVGWLVALTATDGVRGQGSCVLAGLDGFDGVFCNTMPPPPVPCPCSNGGVPVVRYCQANMTYPCGTPPAPNLPPFPAVNQTGQYACVAWTVTATGVTLTGTLNMKYARTWRLSLPGLAGTTQQAGQAWRFLINGDFTTSSMLAPCPIPPCVCPPAPDPCPGPIHFVGHVDYACIETSIRTTSSHSSGTSP